MLTLFGIKNCDSVKRARDWLTDAGVEFGFHDFRKDGIDAATIQGWLDAVGPDVLINRQSATWRTMDDSQRHQVDKVNPVPVLISQPTLIKRPVLVDGSRVLVGFSNAEYQQFVHEN